MAKKINKALREFSAHNEESKAINARLLETIRLEFNLYEFEMLIQSEHPPKFEYVVLFVSHPKRVLNIDVVAMQSFINGFRVGLSSGVNKNEKAEKMREVLKEEFPDTIITVYVSGLTWVTWTNGPSKSQVVEALAEFEFSQRSYNRKYTKEFVQPILDDFCARWDVKTPEFVIDQEFGTFDFKVGKNWGLMDYLCVEIANAVEGK